MHHIRTQIATQALLNYPGVYLLQGMRSPSPAWFVMPALVYTSILAIAGGSEA